MQLVDLLRVFCALSTTVLLLSETVDAEMGFIDKIIFYPKYGSLSSCPTVQLPQSRRTWSARFWLHFLPNLNLTLIQIHIVTVKLPKQSCEKCLLLLLTMLN